MATRIEKQPFPEQGQTQLILVKSIMQLLRRAHRNQAATASRGRKKSAIHDRATVRSRQNGFRKLLARRTLVLGQPHPVKTRTTPRQRQRFLTTTFKILHPHPTQTGRQFNFFPLLGIGMNAVMTYHFLIINHKP